MASDSESTCSSTSTSITTEATPVVYMKNDVDYSDYAIDFLSDEPSYYTYIASYTTEQDVMLFIRENGIVAKSAKFDTTGKLTEVETEKEFVSIIDWVSAYKGEAASIDFALDNVFIGEDLVPLWKVLVDVKEEDELERKDIIQHENLCLNMFQKYMLLAIMGLYILIGIILLSVVSLGHQGR